LEYSKSLEGLLSFQKVAGSISRHKNKQKQDVKNEAYLSLLLLISASQPFKFDTYRVAHHHLSSIVVNVGYQSLG